MKLLPMRQGSYLILGIVLGLGTSLPLVTHADVPASTRYNVEAKIIELPNSHASVAGFLTKDDLGKLINEKDINILSAPSVQTLANQKASISVTRDFQLPDGSTRPLGTTLEVTPNLEKNSFSGWNITYQDTQFVGYQDTSAKKVVLSVQRYYIIMTESDLNHLPSGQYQAFELPPRHLVPPVYDAAGKQIEAFEDKHRQVVLIRIARV